MKPKFVKMDVEILKPLLFLPDESVGVGLRAMMRTVWGDGAVPDLKDSDAAAYGLLMICANESIEEHKRAVERGKSSARSRGYRVE